MKDISIVVINYNTAKYTIDCVKSVLEKTSSEIDYEIVVVDNNSEIEDYQYLKKHFPEKKNIRLVRSIINTGFGGGNMFGVQFVSKSKYLLFLNNDAFLQNNCLGILLNYMDSNGNIGVSTAQNFDENGKQVSSFDHFKGIRKLLFGRGFLQRLNPQEFPNRNKAYKQPVTVNFVNGAFMFFRSEVFEIVGGFDNNIFLYFEEMDICYRMKKMGYASALVPEAKITHFQGASTGKSKIISKEGLISFMYVIKKNYSNWKYYFIWIYYVLTFTLKPKKWFLLKTILNGAHLSLSLKQKQILRV